MVGTDTVVRHRVVSSRVVRQGGRQLKQGKQIRSSSTKTEFKTAAPKLTHLATSTLRAVPMTGLDIGDNPEGINLALGALLPYPKSLKGLHVCWGADTETILESICKPGPTPRSLRIHQVGCNAFDDEILWRLFSSCPHTKQLSVQLPSINTSDVRFEEYKAYLVTFTRSVAFPEI